MIDLPNYPMSKVQMFKYQELNECTFFAHFQYGVKFIFEEKKHRLPACIALYRHISIKQDVLMRCRLEACVTFTL